MILKHNIFTVSRTVHNISRYACVKNQVKWKHLNYTPITYDRIAKCTQVNYKR